MAPEILQGKKTYERSADVYSFGIMMANIANEKVPFEDDPTITTAWQFESMVIAGNRPTIDNSMPVEFKNLAALCWSAAVTERPSFADIVLKLDPLFRSEVQK